MTDEWHEEARGEWFRRCAIPGGAMVGRVHFLPKGGWFGTVNLYHTSDRSLYLYGPRLYRVTQEEAQSACDTLMNDFAAWFDWEKK